MVKNRGVYRFDDEDLKKAVRMLAPFNSGGVRFVAQSRDFGYELGVSVSEGRGPEERRHAVTFHCGYGDEDAERKTKMIEAFNTTDEFLVWMIGGAVVKLMRWLSETYNAP